MAEPPAPISSINFLFLHWQRLLNSQSNVTISDQRYLCVAPHCNIPAKPAPFFIWDPLLINPTDPHRLFDLPGLPSTTTITSVQIREAPVRQLQKTSLLTTAMWCTSNYFSHCWNETITLVAKSKSERLIHKRRARPTDRVSRVFQRGVQTSTVVSVISSDVPHEEHADLSLNGMEPVHRWTGAVDTDASAKTK